MSFTISCIGECGKITKRDVFENWSCEECRMPVDHNPPSTIALPQALAEKQTADHLLPPYDLDPFEPRKENGLLPLVFYYHNYDGWEISDYGHAWAYGSDSFAKTVEFFAWAFVEELKESHAAGRLYESLEEYFTKEEVDHLVANGLENIQWSLKPRP